MHVSNIASQLKLVNCSLLNIIKSICLTRTIHMYHVRSNFSRCIYLFQVIIKDHHASLVNSRRVHTTKGWKIIARTGQKSLGVVKADDAPVSCEDGTGAISHEHLISKLQCCTSVSEQIKLFSSIMSITPEEMKNRHDFCQELTEIFKPYFDNFKVHQFGSSINGLGFKGCDVDVSIQTFFDETKQYIAVEDVPSLDSVLQGKVSPDTVSRMYPRYLLRFIRRILRRHCPGVKEPILLIKARCPILRFYNEKYDVFCDFSCENKSSLTNTRLICFISHLDERFRTLAKLVRYWGKHGGFVGDIDMFNSYAFTLIVIYFLQNVDPPLLLSVNEMLAKSEYLRSGAVNDIDLILHDLKRFQPSQNTKSVEELLREFFFYLLYYDFSRVMQPFSASSVPKHKFMLYEDAEAENFEFGAVNVQDPFRHSFNTTTTAMYKSCRKFLNGLVEVCKAYQDESLWTPQMPNWGICALFHRPLSETETMRKWQRDQVHTIKMPFTLNAAHSLKAILEYGLLFKCTEFNLKHELGKNLLLKMNCSVYHNIWQDRNRVLQEKYLNCDIKDPLEIEHLISLELSESTESKNTLLFQFFCECNEIKENDDNYITVTLTFSESKFPPVVAIFLKEYIPRIFKTSM